MKKLLPSKLPPHKKKLTLIPQDIRRLEISEFKHINGANSYGIDDGCSSSPH